MKINQQLPKDLVLAVALAAKKNKGSADAELDEGEKKSEKKKSDVGPEVHRRPPFLAAYQKKSYDDDGAGYYYDCV